jgi:hypothetical protein
MRLLESYVSEQQRRSLSGLVALCEAGKISVTDLTDEELERLIAGETLDMRQLSDDELIAIIKG